jgi:hypothetical protein
MKVLFAVRFFRLPYYIYISALTYIFHARFLLTTYYFLTSVFPLKPPILSVPNDQSLTKRIILGHIDLMWSDPDDVDNWAVSPRGAGWLFGGSVAREVRTPSPSHSLINH